MKKYILLFVILTSVVIKAQVEYKEPIRMWYPPTIFSSGLYPINPVVTIGNEWNYFHNVFSRSGTIDTLNNIVIYPSILGYGHVTPFKTLMPRGHSNIGDENNKVHNIWSENLNGRDIDSVFAKPDYENLSANLDEIIVKMNQLSKPVIEIGAYGNSIMASGNGLENDYANNEYPYKSFYTSVPKIMMDSLWNKTAFNEPEWRNIEHTDWTTTGSWTVYNSYAAPSRAVGGERIKESQTNGATAQITISSAQYVNFIFESIGLLNYGSSNSNFITNMSVGTGVALIEVSTNGGSSWINPSSLLNDISSDTTYGKFVDGIDTLDTYFADVSSWDATNDFQINPYHTLGYMLDSSVSYTFKFTWDSAYTARAGMPIRLWGCYSWSGNTAVVINVADPGDAWHWLKRKSFGTIYKNRFDLVFFEAPYWHNFFDYGVGDVRINVDSFMERMADYKRLVGTDFIIMSPPPGGVHPSGSWNGSSWDYYPSENIMNATTTTGYLNLSSEDTVTYAVAYEMWTHDTRKYTMKYKLGWLDIYGMFKKFVESSGDSLTSTGWLVDTTSTYYNEWRGDGVVNGYNFDSVYVNVMTRFTSLEDGHHLVQAGFRKWYDMIHDAVIRKIKVKY